MADSKQRRGPEDGRTIALGQRHEVRYWTGALGITEARLREVVAAVGHSAKAVRARLAQDHGAPTPGPESEPSFVANQSAPPTE